MQLAGGEKSYGFFPQLFLLATVQALLSSDANREETVGSGETEGTATNWSRDQTSNVSNEAGSMDFYISYPDF